MHDGMNKDQPKPKRQNAHRDPRQDEKGPDSIEQRTVPCALTVSGGRLVDRSARG